MRRESAIVLAFVTCFAVVVGCGPQDAPIGIPIAIGPSDTNPGTPTTVPSGAVGNGATVQGTLFFRKVQFTNRPTLTQSINNAIIEVDKPIRAADVAAVDANLNVIAGTQGSTNDNGFFTISVPPLTPFRIIVFASTASSNGRANIEVRDNVVTPATGNLYSFVASSLMAGFPVGSVNTVQTDIVPDTLPSRPSGPFNILDAGLTVSDLVRAANASAALRKLTYCWDPNNRTLGSFFVAQGGPSNGPIIIVRGGDGTQDDTDEYDDSVLCHEYGHFVVEELSRDVSLGGDHGPNDQTYQTLAFSEGTANWISCVALKTNLYVDAQAIQGANSSFTLNLETRNGDISGTTGPTSENSVGEILWDLVDGANGLVDTDNDGVAFTFQNVLDAYKLLRTSAGTFYVIIDDVLATFTGANAARIAAVTQVLNVPPGQLGIVPQLDQFPLLVGIPSTTTNNTCTTIQTVGGRNIQDSGIDAANRFFRFNMTNPGTVTVTATLQPTALGTDADGTNLDMYLLDPNNQILARSKTQGTVEKISTGIGSGRFYILVTGRPDPTQGLGTNAVSKPVLFDLSISSP